MARRAPAQVNQSLIGGLDCLRELVLADGPVGVRELARRLDMEPTRASRLLGTLGCLGLAEQDESRKYRPGPGVHVLSALSLHGSHLLTRSLPVLRDLAVNTGLTVALGVLWRSHVCYLYHGSAGTPLELAIGARQPFPAHRSSIGRVLLAHGQGASELPAELLARVRERGYARGGLHGESLAVSVGNPPIAALALAGDIPASREAELADLLRAAAARIDSVPPVQSTKENEQ